MSDLVLPLELAPHLPELGVAALGRLDVTARWVKGRHACECIGANILHHVHVNVSQVDRNSAKLGRGQTPSPGGGEIVRDGAVDDAGFCGGHFDALPKRCALVRRQRERLQALDQAQVADGGEVEADVGQRV